MIDDPRPKASLVLSGGKASDFGAGELTELARELVDTLGEEISVGVAEERASGPLPDEILHVTLTLGEGYAFSKALDATLAWAWRRWRRRREEAAGRDEPAQPTVVHFEGTESIIFRLDLPDGKPLTWDGPVYPRGRRRPAPRWVAGPAAPPAPANPDAAWVLPVKITESDAQALRRALAAGSFDPNPAAAAPEMTIPREDGGPPMETIVRVMIAAPEREVEATAAIGRWSQARAAADRKPCLCIAAVVDTEGVVLRRPVISPIPAGSRPHPSAGIAPSVRGALLDLGLIDPEDFEVDLWHATDPGSAEAIIAEQLLRCDANGVAYLSSSPDIAGMLSATGEMRKVLLRLRVPQAVLDISKDWRPGGARVDFHFLCGSFFAGAVTVVERRDI